jgi:hypothetical protein
MKRKFSDEHIIEIIKEYDAGVNPIWLVEWGAANTKMDIED